MSSADDGMIHTKKQPDFVDILKIPFQCLLGCSIHVRLCDAMKLLSVPTLHGGPEGLITNHQYFPPTSHRRRKSRTSPVIVNYT